MTGRPDLAAVAALALDDRGRMRRNAARMAVAVFRCDPPRRHLQAFILPTTAGLAVIWRPADLARKARDVWAEEWLDDAPDVIHATCNCRVNTPISLAPYRRPSAIR
jgi:hypothetical protein